MPIRYRGLVFDSVRWDGFELRRGDIVIATPPKCGTTWTQMIVALLVLQDPELDRPLAVISPWIDMTTRARSEVVADLEAQTHRRFIKTHTPLDGLPMTDEVTYICVGRDPRDVAVSMDNHRDNLDLDHFAASRARAAAVDGIELEGLRTLPPRPTDPRERFWHWVDDDTDPTEAGAGLRYTLHHLASFRSARSDLDVVFLHYDDLRADLEAEMRSLAARLGIAVPEERWPALVKAATFDEMRSRAAVTVPGASREQWRDPARFFNKGTSGQWRELLDDVDLERYAARARAVGPHEVVEWVHRPALPDDARMPT